MMTPKYARKAKRGKKTAVVSRTTPASVVLLNPPGDALKSEKSVIGVLTKRYAVLKSWQAVAIELKSNKGTLNKIVSTAKDDRPLLPTKKLIARMNEVYGCHLHYAPRVVEVAPLPCGHAPAGKRCPICQPPTKYPAHAVTRISRLTNRDRAKREFEAAYPALNFTPIDPGENLDGEDYWNRETQRLWECWLESRMVAAEPATGKGG